MIMSLFVIFNISCTLTYKHSYYIGCYSACTDCEYKIPDIGYRITEQSSPRPKWIAAYDHRSFLSSGEEHVSK